MAPTLYFLSRTTGQQLGGQLIRSAQIDYFRRLGYRVRVVAPDYGGTRVPNDDDTILTPFKVPQRIGSALQHIGLVDDYLFDWARRALALLTNMVQADDIVFASSGGELSCLRIGSEVQRLRGCRYIANLHDPISHATVDGITVGRALHVSRDKWEARYLSNADLIVVSTRSYQQALIRKYPQLADRIRHMYFGYINKLPVVERQPGRPLRVAYGGMFLRTQSPERLAEVAAAMDAVEVVYIGHHDRYRPLRPFRSVVRMVPAVSHAKYNEYLMHQVDVGFVSLADERFRHCVPSKIFEYINAGLPIVGALPRGEAAELINDSGYGIAVEFADGAALRRAITTMTDPDRWAEMRNRVLQDRDSWSLSSRMQAVSGEVLHGGHGSTQS